MHHLKISAKLDLQTEARVFQCINEKENMVCIFVYIIDHT